MPRLALLTTGGTIAGTGNPQHYQAATLDAQTLFAGVPALQQIARWQIEQVFQLDSRDLLPAHWLVLAQKIRALQADPAIDGIVLTHGTDTIEETAYALHLLLPAGKPVVMTAAMRPADSTEADGPANLEDAARLAAFPGAAGLGVLVTANHQIIAGAELVKTHTSSIEALQPRPACTALGTISNKHISICRQAPLALRDSIALGSDAALPRVDILYGYAGVPADLPELCARAGARGLVLALTGHGSIPAAWRESLQYLIHTGIAVVRGTRIGTGGVFLNHNEDDLACGTLPAGPLTPQQARVLLTLGLAGRSAAQLQTLFAQAAAG